MSIRATFIGVLFALAGCVANPPSNVHQPMTAKPVAQAPAVYSDGAIFHAGANERPLFEDRRARNVGDILTINIVEKTTANRQNSASSSAKNSVNATTPSVTVGPLAKLLLKAFSVTSASDNSSSATGAGSASEDLTGTITVTVIEVLANGNMLVSGEKQVGINNSDEYIRFSGVVNPITITAANTVQSPQVADARIEYRSGGAMREVVNDAQTLGFLGRFFLSVLPF
ncbi:MAG TPA: flagellar basal body L-ring protein FlgH [Gallionella sp.]|nr:flagellar basal body L-ring protein FlgH [Gallionella sp.]